MIYISGKMTGVENLNREKFEYARSEIRQFWDGKIIIPHELEIEREQFETEAEWYARLLLNDLRVIASGDVRMNVVVLLDDWQNSKGARAEKAFAEAVGVKVCELRDFLVLLGGNL